MSWKLPLSDRDRLNALKEDEGEGHGFLSDYFRACIEAAVAVTPEPSDGADELVRTSARFKAEEMSEISRAASAAGIEPTLWLTLITSSYGEVLLKQLAAARDLRDKVATKADRSTKR